MGRIVRIILAYVLWSISAALSLWGVLALRTVLVADVPIELLRVSYWSLRLWNVAGSALVGIAWLVFVMATEGYFREAADETFSVMLKRAAQVLAAEVVFLGMVHGVRLLI